MNVILLRASRNFFLRHPWQLGLAITGIALAVAVVVSIDLVRSSAERSFEQSTEAVVGKATHRIVAGPSGLDENLYTRLRVEYGVRDIAPLIEGYVTVENEQKRETLTLLGIDPFAERTFRDYARFDSLQDENKGSILVPMLTEANTILLDSTTAARLGAAANEQVKLTIGSRHVSVRILGILGNTSSSSIYSLENLMLADIATAQELLGMQGRLSRIDVVLTDGDIASEGYLKSILPKEVALLPAAMRSESVKQMTRAFHTNLSALSLLALLVGMFLIYNTMTFMVMQRRPLLGRLRALGTTRQQLFTIIAVEALVIGFVASVIGLLLGIGLAQGLLQVVNRTINELYYVLPDSNLALSPFVMLKAGLLGVMATLLAAIPPALEASNVTPQQALMRSHLERRTRQLLGKASLPGIAAIIIGFFIINLSGKSIGFGFTGIFVIILGFTLLTPMTTVVMMTLLKPVFGRVFGTLGRQACADVVATLSRTAAAVAALMIAIATVIGIGLMVNNFRLSVDHWLQNLLRADMYVAVPGPESSASHSYLDQTFAKAILALPEVREVSNVRRTQIESRTGMTQLVAYGLNDDAYQGFQFKEGKVEEIRMEFEEHDGVIISEPYAYHNELKINDWLELRTDSGYRKFKVLGVYTDYGSDRGVVSLSRRTYERYWKDDRYSGLGIYTVAGTDMALLRTKVQALAPDQNLWLQDRSKILQASLEVFDNTFVITEILRVLAAIIAFIGVFSALMALQLERTQEHGLLRAIGFLPAQVRTLIITETGLLGLVAGVLAIPVGCMITALLIIVINRRSFGWTMDLQFSPEIILQGIILGLLAALLAGIYPAWLMSRTEPAQALRTE
ncbi:MAG: putative ABC transport system permease protein [Gammaproteobacteria bacterium]|jgi:putative ABC transport system permease protein